jgi:hypothetical protein
MLLLKSNATKVVAGFVGLAFALTMFLGATAPAHAQSMADLQAQIAALSAQLTALQGTPSTTMTTGYTFNVNLKMGSRGTDVMNLQKVLNAIDGTQLATIGAGSPGKESTYFGGLTRAAVIRFQQKYGITPAVGYVGPITRAKLNSMRGGIPASTSTPVTGCSAGAMYSSTTGQACPTTGTGTTTPTTGPISVMLSTDNPAAGTIVSGQATADLMHITFTGNGTVNSVNLHRAGISDQNTLTNVYLYDGVNRITDGYSFNVNGNIVVNGLNLAVNGSKTISVRADVAALAYQTASTISVSLLSFTAGTSVNTVNLMGNSMFVATGGSLASAVLSAVSSPAVSTTPTVNANTTSYTFWSAPLQVNTRAVTLKAANFRMIGSAPSDALANIKLYVDGVATGMAATVTALNGSNYAMFDFSSAPITLNTGSHTIDVRADVVKGSNRTVQFSIQNGADLMIMDPQVGVNIAVSGAPANAATVTINTGSATVVIDPTFQALTNITGGASNVAIGKFKVHAYGEDVKVQSLQVTPVLTPGNSLDQVTLYFNGSQVGTQQQWTGGTLTYQLGSQMIAAAGVASILEVRANIRSSTSTNYTTGTVSANLIGGTANAQGQNSLSTLAFPGTTVTGTSLTIQTGLLSVSSNAGYASQNANPNTAGVKIGSFVLQNQSSSESVRVTTLNVALGFGAPQFVTNYSALRTSETSGSGGTPVQPSASNTFSVDFTLAPGATKTIDILADTSATTGGTIQSTLTVNAIGVSSNVSIAGTPVAGQTITLASGTLGTPTLLTTTATVSQYVAAGTSGGVADATKATFTFNATNGTVNISELKFSVTGSGVNPITFVKVGNVSANVIGGVAYLTGLNLVVPNGGSGLNVDTLISYSQAGINGVTSGATSTVSLGYVKYSAGGTTATLCTSAFGTCTAALGSAIASPIMTIVGSKPTVALAPVNGTLTVGTKYIADVRVSADTQGDIKINTLPLVFTGNASGTTITSANTVIKDASGTVIPNATVTTSTGSGTSNAVATITFTGGYQITGGTTQTFKIEVPVGALNGTTGNSVAVGLGATSLFTWTDLAGSGSSAAQNGVLMTNYPTATVSLNN